MKQKEAQNSVCCASVGVIKNKNICVYQPLYVWCMYARVSWEEFTEIGKNGCFWEGSWRLGVERKLIFYSMTLLYLLSFLSCACIIYPSVHKHKGRKWERCFRTKESNVPSTWEALGTVLSVFLLPVPTCWALAWL